MKMIIKEEVNEGLESLLGKKVLVFCLNYIYSGVLVGVNTTCIKLDDAGIVYETGAFTSDKFTDFQKVGHPIYVQTAAIESFSETKKS